mgnify:FL=1
MSHSYHRGHRHVILLRDASTVYLDNVDLVTGYEGFSAGEPRLHYAIEERCAWHILDRPDLTVVAVWADTNRRASELWLDRFHDGPAWSAPQVLVFDEVARVEAAGGETLAVMLNNKTLTALRDRHELVMVHKGHVRLTSLGRHIAWLRDHPQPKRPVYGEPIIPTTAR